MSIPLASVISAKTNTTSVQIYVGAAGQYPTSVTVACKDSNGVPIDFTAGTVALSCFVGVSFLSPTNFPTYFNSGLNTCTFDTSVVGQLTLNFPFASGNYAAGQQYLLQVFGYDTSGGTPQQLIVGTVNTVATMN
jgi:hypothetical protein